MSEAGCESDYNCGGKEVVEETYFYVDNGDIDDGEVY